ncbi:MAG: hypothetical protein N2Z62_11820 [Rhodobacteraceae bacterium]|nr:hypothetical protein [Paracoccaceae bacterium]
MMVARFRALAALSIVLLVAACGATYRTYYAAPVDPAVSRGWRVVDVAVRVPEQLTVSEEKSLVPRADIVWREDPPGDRKAQIAAILDDAITRGASGLRGPRPVRFLVTVRRFHALTFEAEARLTDAGVHNIQFDIAVVDARTGETLRGPELIQAETPAFSGYEAVRRRSAGETQRSVITNHVAATIAGWLGTGPDQRGSFSRLGD